MDSIRLQRVNRQMEHIISRIVTQELRDPRCGFITIVGARVAPDLKTAHVNFSVLGTDAQKRSAGRALESARGYIQARAAKEVQLKYTPVIAFHLDESAERDIRLVRQIDDVVKADERARTARAIRARIAAGSVPPDVIDEVNEAAASEETAEFIATTLAALVDVDTTARAADAERRCLDIIETALKQAGGGEIETRFAPIGPEIQDDPAYVPPARADGTPIPYDEAWNGRSNLLAVLRTPDIEGHEPELPDDGLRPMRLTLHTHVDTAPPHAPSSRHGDVVTGRGASDAKGQAATILVAFQLLRLIRDRFGVRLRSDLGAQFVIGEKAGGGGSLGIALQNEFPSDGIIVCHPTDLCPYETGTEAESTLALYAVETGKRLGLDLSPQPGGRDLTPGAALLADIFPNRDVLAFGPGRGTSAEPPFESISLREIAAGAKMLVFLTLESAGLMC